MEMFLIVILYSKIISYFIYAVIICVVIHIIMYPKGSGKYVQFIKPSNGSWFELIDGDVGIVKSIIASDEGFPILMIESHRYSYLLALNPYEVKSINIYYYFIKRYLSS